MTVAIRNIAGTARDRLAYVRKFAARTTCFVYCFQDNLWGWAPSPSTTSHEMLRLAWGHRPQLRIVEQELTLKHPAILELFRQSGGTAPDISPSGDDEMSANPCNTAHSSRRQTGDDVRPWPAP